uniref:BPL/LPL catalytic domain-containing protein n=1 Tax=Spongospora subterranea TaxID=70186 RepID=A0A0H5R8K1_9EUKA|eukprot:CRZ10131.1 hypothetical protein [Spongospora subterranea]
MAGTPSRPFSVDLFRSLLTTKAVGRAITYVDNTTSTMDLAAIMAKEGAASGSIAMAESQTNGVGRGNGRIWSSPPLHNLYTTFIIRPNSMTDAVKINLGMGLAIAKTARRFGAAKAGVKWPNDVWIEEKKLCGILTNSDSNREQGLVLMVGIGTNINEEMRLNPNPDVARSAISMSDCIGKPVDREAFLAAMCEEIEVMLGQSQDQVVGEYRKYDVLTGKDCLVMPRKLENSVDHYGAIYLGIDDSGQLRVRVDGALKLLSFEEVSVRPRVSAPLPESK